MIITLENIDYTYKYGDLAINNLSLSLTKNEKIAILGFEKSGKTTLLKVIAGLIAPTKGKVIINNNVAQCKTINKQNIQMVFSHGGFFKLKTFKGNLAYGFKKQKYDKEQINYFLSNPFNKLSLSSYHTLGFTLDNEEIVRLNMERIFHWKSDILLIDNIFNLLNLENRFEIFLQYIDLFKSDTQTLIFATNSIDEAFMVSNKVIYIEQGQIVDILYQNQYENFTNSLKLLKAIHPFINEKLFEYDNNKIIAAYTLSLVNYDKESIQHVLLDDIDFNKHKFDTLFYKNKKIIITKHGFLELNYDDKMQNSKIFISNIAFYDYYGGFRVKSTLELLNKFYNEMQIESN